MQSGESGKKKAHLWHRVAIFINDKLKYISNVK